MKKDKKASQPQAAAVPYLTPGFRVLDIKSRRMVCASTGNESYERDEEGW